MNQGDWTRLNQLVVYDTRNSRILFILGDFGFILKVDKTKTSIM